MTNLKVQYSREKCIGQGNCYKIAPKYFKVVDGKAILNGSSETQTAELNADASTTAKLIEAAEACPVNAIRVINAENNKDLVTVQLEQQDMKEASARYDDNTEFVLDPKGYFLIKIDRENETIEVGFCNEKNKMILKVVGKKPIDIYTTIFNKEKLQLRMDHAAYLGRELQKAYIALKKNLKYVQDDELEL